MTTFEKVQKIIAERLSVDIARIAPETDLAADLKADSLEIAELYFMLEEELNITLDENEALKLRTVGDIVKLIDKGA